MESHTDDETSDEEFIGVSKYNNKSNVICYMNSIFAILQQTPIFTDYILTAQFKDKIKVDLKDSILFQFYNILKLSHSHNNYNINPDTFRNIITKKDDMWGEHEHQDSQEFLTFLLNNIEEEIAEKVQYIHGRLLYIHDKSPINNLINIMAINSWKKFVKNEYSIIKNLFGGMTHINNKCSCCGNISHNFDFFQILQLSISNETDCLDDCLDNFVKEETMDINNMIKCDFCNHRNKSIKKISLWTLPKILIIQLKRFRTNNYGVISEKINNMIKYPIKNLDMTKYMDPNSKKVTTYDLFAINNHHSIGKFNSINFGHYTTNVINRYNNKWYKFDDSKELEEISQDDLVNKNAYMLFYYRND